MNQLKSGITSPSSKTTAEKNLIKILNETSSDISFENQLNPLLDALSYYTGTIEGLELYDKIFNHLRTYKNRLGVLKALYISHHAINRIGEPFIKVLLSEFFHNVLPSSKTITKDEYLLGILAANYYNFLMTYAHYSQDIQTYFKMNVEIILNSIKHGEFGHLIKLITYKNIVKYFITIKDSIEGALANLKKPVLVEKITCLLLSNISRIYNMISRILGVIVEHIFDLDKDIALLIDELYSDTLQITRKIKTFIDKLNLKDNFSFEYFVLDHEFNQKEELYITSLKNSSSIQNQSDSIYLEEKQMYQNFKVGKREYRVDSENWSIGKFNLPEKKHILENNHSIPSIKTNLLTSLISPRASQKKNDFHKSFTSPIMDLKYLQRISDTEQGIFSARESTLGLERDWKTPSGSASLKNEDFDQGIPKLEFNSHMRSNTFTLNNWDSQSGNSSARDSILSLSSPKKGTFSGLFGRKNKQIMPFLGRSSFLGSKS